MKKATGSTIIRAMKRLAAADYKLNLPIYVRRLTRYFRACGMDRKFIQGAIAAVRSGKNSI